MVRSQAASETEERWFTLIRAAALEVRAARSEHVTTSAYHIRGEDKEALMDLGQVDWKAVQDMFATGRQRTAAQETPFDALGADHETHAPQPDTGRSDRAIPEAA